MGIGTSDGQYYEDDLHFEMGFSVQQVDLKTPGGQTPSGWTVIGPPPKPEPAPKPNQKLAADKYGRGSDLDGPYTHVPSDADMSDEEWNETWKEITSFGRNFKNKYDPKYDLPNVDEMLKTLPEGWEMFRWEKGREGRKPMYMIRPRPQKKEDLIS